MSDPKMQIVIGALNQTQQAFAELQRSLGDAQKQLSGFGSSVKSNTGGGSSAVESLATSFGGLKGMLSAVTAAFAALKLGEIIKDSTLLAARVETLGIVMGVVGNNAGYTKAEMDKYAQGVAAMGITIEESRQTVVKMAQANLDLSKSSQLARMAQDAAVLANQNSSESLNGIMNGITTLQPEVLRTYGIIVNFETAYKKVALATGRTTEMITSQEKQQIALNEVLSKASTIAGTYETAMETVGKQLTSLPRYAKDLGTSFGEVFTPVLSVIVKDITQSLKDMGEWFKNNPQTVREWGAALVETFINIKAEFIRLSMLIDKTGGTMSSAMMLLYGPGAALGNENSKKQFERYAQINIDLENRYKEKEKQLEELALKADALKTKILTPAAKTTTTDAEAEKAAAARAANAKREAEEKRLLAMERNAQIAKAKEDAWLNERKANIKAVQDMSADAVKLEAAELEESYKKRLISEEDYFSQKLALQEYQLRSEKSLLLAEERAVEESWNRKKKTFLPGKDDAEKIKDQAQVAAELSKIRAAQASKDAEIDTIRSKSSADSFDRQYRNEKARLDMSVKTAETLAKLEKERLSLAEQSGAVVGLQARRQELEIEERLLATKKETAQEELKIAKQGDERTKVEEKLRELDAESSILNVRRKLAEIPYGSFTDGFRKGLAEFYDETQRTFQLAADMAKSTAQAMQSAFSDFFFDAMTGKMKSLASYVTSFLNAIARSISNMLANSLVGSITNSVGGFFNNGAGASNTSAQPGTVKVGHQGGLILHGGGLVVPRFHFGGLADNEVPAILMKRERVLSVEQNKLFENFVNKTQGNGATDITIKLENNTGKEMKQKDGGTTFDGKSMVKLIILEAMDTDPSFRNAVRG